MHKRPLSDNSKNHAALLRELHNEPESHWQERGEQKVLKLCRAMAKRVPAYGNFLCKNGISANKIKTIGDFRQLPVIDKNNYLRAYPLPALCWDGELRKGQHTFAATSGSTGEPFYFPRGKDQDRQYSLMAELYLRNNFKIHERSTLYINSFAMGVWIGGVFTHQAIKLLADRGGYALSIISPGINKAEIFKAVKRLGSNFDQVVIGGYPPFIKDVIDDGPENGVNWSDYKLKIIFSAEAFSEDFRDYICEKACLANVYTDTLNHYGTVDLGTMSHETPLTIFLRRLSRNNTRIYSTLFRDATKSPTLTQFLPEMFFFEEIDGGLLCSAESGIPLIRYDLKDRGGIFSLKEIMYRLEEMGVLLDKEIESAGIAEYAWNLPFVYVYERSDFAVSLCGANVYPEEVREALQRKPIFDWLTSKFTMAVKDDENLNQQLHINLELRPRCAVSNEIEKIISKEIVENLLRRNSEYASNYRAAPDRVIPKLIFWPYEHPLFFKPGTKQKWSEK